MKKLVLMLCVFAHMANAQVGHLPVVNEHRPDSIYTYSGNNKALYSGAAISNDDAGRKTLESGFTNENNDNVLDENDQAYKIEYTYTEADGMLKVEEVQSRLSRGEWEDYMKIVQLYNTANPNVPVERYDYSLFKGEWLMFANTIGTEFDERGLPVVLMDTVFDTYRFTAGFSETIEASEIKRMEVAFNDDRMPATITEFNPEGPIEDNDTWILFRKRENVYDEDKKLIKDFYSYPDGGDGWVYSYEFRYTYDEKDNIASVMRMDEAGSDFEMYYENVYLPEGNANEPVAGISKKIKITFANEQIQVLSENSTPFNVSVYSMQGVLVAQQKGSHTVTIPLNDASSGVYIVHVLSGGRSYTHKLYKR